MPITTLSSRELHQNAGKAKRAAKKGPVFITDRGRPSLVILTIEEYNQLRPRGPKKKAPKEKTIVELLAMPKGTPAFDADFEFPRLEFRPRPVDFD